VFKIKLFFTFLLVQAFVFGQNIQVSETAFTPQQLIEDVLINNGCIQNIQVTNTVSGNFTDGSLSYGFFNSNGSDFPLSSGLVLSTGKLSNVPGPNSTLSDDDAPGWSGDADLEAALGITNTINATIIEFEFTPVADAIEFRYLFASEEYQEGDPNTCRFSDAFAFLIRPQGGQYTNLALIPGTQTPVLVTTVHPEIPGGCPAINEEFFDTFNGVDAPINFNGQTKVLTAQTTVIPNQIYEIKLVLADEENFRFDSAVFLEANSFNISADLGPDRLLATNNPVCDGEEYILDATPPSGIVPDGYRWFLNGNLIQGQTNATLTVLSAGTYTVAVDYGGGCIANGDVVIEYNNPIIPADVNLFQCEENQTGIATFNLFDASDAILDGNTDIQVQGFYFFEADAENGVSPIPNPTSYTNSIPSEIVYARVVDPFGCFGISEVTLLTTTTVLGPYDLVVCSFEDDENVGLFNTSEVTLQITTDIGFETNVTYYNSYAEAILEQNVLPETFENTVPNSQIIFARAEGVEGCLGIAQVNLFVVPTPQFEESNAIYYCLDIFPEDIRITSGVLGTEENYTYEWSTLDTTPYLDINEPGDYSVDVTFSQEINGVEYTCTATNTISVLPSEIATIEVEVTGTFGNQNIIVTAIGQGDYEYSLYENIGFQNSNEFINVLGGIYTVYVRDKNGCGTVSQTVYVLDFPQFFTPNQDGFNDRWQIRGLNKISQQVQRIEIFNRNGKLLKVLSPTSAGWNGTYNGNPLPSNDYWFVAHFTEGGEYRNHFTLKR
jgi:gliding motility-associated-like protein